MCILKYVVRYYNKQAKTRFDLEKPKKKRKGLEYTFLR